MKAPPLALAPFLFAPLLFALTPLPCARAQASLPVQGPSKLTSDRAAVVVPRCETAANSDIGGGIAVACGTHGTPAAGGVAPTAFTPASCASSTVGATPTLILGAAASGGARAGGGFMLPPDAAGPVFFSWTSNAPTTTAGGGTWRLDPGGVILFAGAPATALYGIAATPVVGSCMASAAP